MSEANNLEAGRSAQGRLQPSWLDLVREQVASIRFGAVLITVHEARVVQVERSEKLRLDQPPATTAAKADCS